MATCKDCFHWCVCQGNGGAYYSDGAEHCSSWADQSMVAVLPCKIGDDIWWINEETNTVECHKNGVYGVLVKSDGVYVMDECGCLDKIGTKWCYLSKEAAEKALAEREV